jgi:hypothetical protein
MSELILVKPFGRSATYSLSGSVDASSSIFCRGFYLSC